MLDVVNSRIAFRFGSIEDSRHNAAGWRGNQNIGSTMLPGVAYVQLRQPGRRSRMYSEAARTGGRACTARQPGVTHAAKQPATPPREIIPCGSDGYGSRLLKSGMSNVV